MKNEKGYSELMGKKVAVVGYINNKEFNSLKLTNNKE